MSQFPFSLFAMDVETAINIAIVLLIFVVPVIGQLLKKVREMPPPGQRPIPPRPAPLDVADEIEDFMLRAAQRKPVQAKRQPAAPSPTIVAQPVRAEVVAERPVVGQAGKRLKSQFKDQKFDQREANLGQEVAQTGSELNQHLRQVFDHHVGKLENVSAPPRESPPLSSPAAAETEATSLFTTGLFDLLSDPDALRQAIVLTEILRRPEERWE